MQGEVQARPGAREEQSAPARLIRIRDVSRGALASALSFSRAPRAFCNLELQGKPVHLIETRLSEPLREASCDRVERVRGMLRHNARQPARGGSPQRR
jgi:hypothetical protein